MNYSVLVLRRAQKELAKLPVDVYERAKTTILKLSQEPRPVGCKKLMGREGWRVRLGKHRIIYEIDDVKCTITVLHVGHRRDIYS